MLILKVQNSAAEIEAIFLNIIGPLFVCVLLYFFLKRKTKNEDTETDVGTYSSHIGAKIGAYIFGVLFFIVFLIGIYNGIKFCIK